jgi:hypothetical protein
VRRRHITERWQKVKVEGKQFFFEKRTKKLLLNAVCERAKMANEVMHLID